METIKIIIDTDLLIDLLRKQEQATALITEIEEKNYVLATTSINIFELYHGAHKSQESRRNLKAINLLIRRLVILPLTSKAAKKAGHIYAQLEHQGEPIGLRDTFIAAIAITRECRIATHNHRHFNRIPDIELITP